jgi:hypothetical protein
MLGPAHAFHSVPTRARVSTVVALVALLALPADHAASQEPTGTVDVAQLWEEPTDLLARDLFAGPGGDALTPNAERYQFVAFKKSGKNPGYDVRDGAGRLWGVKMGEEAQPEVTASRILWAIGFHQPPTYYVEQWTLEGEDAGPKGASRFRTELDNSTVTGEWSWYENPFVGTRPFAGLIVAQLVLGNWDLKTSNNKIYEFTSPTAGPRRAYVVRDLGASLGKAKQSRLYKIFRIRDKQGSKNNLLDFEEQGFIKRIEGDRVKFDYRGLDSSLLDVVTVPDVVWACELLSRLPDAHWEAAFKAGGYRPEETARYIRKIKERIAQGMALRASQTTERSHHDSSLDLRREFLPTLSR